MRDRYSVRKFLDEKVEPSLVEKLKEAIMLAPSAVNRQPIRAWVSDFDTEAQQKLFPEMKDAKIVALMQIGYPASEAKPAAWHFQSKKEEDVISYL